MGRQYDVKFLYYFHSLVKKRKLYFLVLLKDSDSALRVNKLNVVQKSFYRIFLFRLPFYCLETHSFGLLVFASFYLLFGIYYLLFHFSRPIPQLQLYVTTLAYAILLVAIIYHNRHEECWSVIK